MGFDFYLSTSIYTVQFLVATICQFSFRAETCYYEWASTEWAGAWLTTAATAARAAAAAAAGNNTVIVSLLYLGHCQLLNAHASNVSPSHLKQQNNCFGLKAKKISCLSLYLLSLCVCVSFFSCQWGQPLIWGSCIFSLSPQFFPQGILFYLPLPKSRPPLKRKCFKIDWKESSEPPLNLIIQYLFPLYFNIFIEKIRIRNILCHNLPRLKLYLGGLGDLGLGGSALRFAGELNSDLWCGLFPCSSLSLTAKMMGKP